MHIAICDDNIVDRKQLERLLKREAERLAGEEPLYVDSYGDLNALLQSPGIYDVFFLDITQSPDELTGIHAAVLLRKQCAATPIVLCSSHIPYRESKLEIPLSFYLDKEIKPQALSNLLSELIALKKSAIPTYEIRSAKETFYIHEEDFLYAVPINNRQCTVHLKDNTTVDVLESTYQMYLRLKKQPWLFYLKKKEYLINLNHIKALSLNAAELDNGEKTALSFSEYTALKKAWKSL